MKNRARLDKGSPFGHAVETAEGLGLVLRAQEIEPNVWVATQGEKGWASVARHIAATLPGMLIPVPGTGGVVWNCGRLKHPGTIVTHEHIDGLRQAREAARNYLPTGTLIPWTVGGIARVMLKYALAPQCTEPYAETLIEASPGVDRDYMYHDCKPGWYRYAAHWDMSACFFNLMSRLDCLRLSVDDDGLHWGGYTRQEKERVAALWEAVAFSHRLRNGLWGVCLGSHKFGYAYTSSPPKVPTIPLARRHWTRRDPDWKPGMVRVCRTKPRLGPFRPAALLVARTASELCQLESMASGSVYSTVDCVVIPSRREPSVWPELGIPFKRKHEGRTHVVGRAVYRFGSHRSEPYKDRLSKRKPGDRWQYRPVPVGELPERLWFREWIG